MQVVKSVGRACLGDVNVERLRRLKSGIESGGSLRQFLRPKRIEILEDLEIIVYEAPDRDTFFGYYDRSPVSPDGTMVLAGTTNFRGAGTPAQAPLKLGLFSRGEERSFKPLAVSNAWSTQQSCMATWINNGDQIIYNDISNGRPCSKIVSVESTKIVAEIPTAIYSVSPKNDLAATCNFARLQRLRPGYGYPRIEDQTALQPCPADDGVFIVDLSTGQSSLIHSLFELSAIAPHPTMSGADHYINHLQFNPTGNRLLFIHLWVQRGLQYSRMFTTSPSGDRLYLLSNLYVSHYCWKTNEELVVYAEAPDGSRGYCQFTDEVGFNKKLFIEQNLPDGHGTFSSEDGMFLTDTYPDELGFENLMLIERSGSLRKLARFYHPAGLAFEDRCDLHPRWSPDQQSVLVDSAPNGLRRIVELKFKNQSL